jgi:DnaJ like chaperone protein
MSWFGKMVGGTIGLMIGGPLGAVAGAVIGHKFFDAQSSQQRVNGPGAYERAQQNARSAGWIWCRRNGRRCTC